MTHMWREWEKNLKLQPDKSYSTYDQNYVGSNTFKVRLCHKKFHYYRFSSFGNNALIYVGNQLNILLKKMPAMVNDELMFQMFKLSKQLSKSF